LLTETPGKDLRKSQMTNLSLLSPDNENPKIFDEQDQGAGMYLPW